MTASVERALPVSARAPSKRALDQVLLVVPTLNEEAGLPEVLRQARELGVATVVIDGGSTDRTRAVADGAGVRVVRVSGARVEGGATSWRRRPTWSGSTSPWSTATRATT